MVVKLVVILSSVFILGTTKTSVQAPFTVAGVVKDKQTGELIRYVHVYTIKGEEEAVTDEKGAFRFQTWRKTAELVTEKEGYKRSLTKLTFPFQKQTILIQKE